jgi:hypothetical protein
MVMTVALTMPVASFADAPTTLPGDVGLYTNGEAHAMDIGDPEYKYETETEATLAPGVPYTADSMFGSIFEKDKLAGGTDYYLDRVLGVSGNLGLTILQTRGRSLYMKGASNNNFNTMGFRGSVYGGGSNSLNGTDLYQVTLRRNNTAQTLTEVSSARFNAPSHAKVSFTVGGTDVRADTKKFITYDNVAVTTVKLTNSGTEAQTFTARAASSIATAPMDGADNVLVGTRTISNNNNNSLTTAQWAAVTIGVQAKDFVLNGANLEKEVTVPAGGSVEFSVVGALWSDELPKSRTEFDRYAALTPDEAFRDGVTAFNERWAKDIPYIDVPSPAVEKAILYRWWGERYNSLDTNESGYVYQFPVTIEGVNLYENAIVLTQPMHLQDTKWMRNPYLAYGQILNVGELSGSSAFLDSPGDGSWNNHYSQYIGTSGLEAYSVHGGGTDIAEKFAYYFEKDGVGQLEHYDGNDNNLISYTANYMPGNDADALTFGYSKSPTSNGRSNIERPESAYVWGDFDAAAKLYGVAGASQTKIDELNDKAGDIKDAIQNLLWDPEEKMFLAKTMEGTTANGPSSRPNHLTDKTHIPVRESNLYDVYAQNLLDPADYETYVDGFRFLSYGDNFPIFPFYTANQYDKSIVSGGSNNFSNINFTVQYRGVRSGLRYYDPDRKWIDEAYAARLLDWMAWSVYPNAGDLRVPSQAEYYSNWNATAKTYNRNNHVHVMLGNMNYIYVEDMGGLQPRLDDKIELWPIDLGYDYFMVNNVRYHGKDVTLVWDEDGSKYGLGAGYSLFIDGVKKVSVDKLGKFTYDPNTNAVDAETGLTVTYKDGDGAAFATAVNTPIDDARVVEYLKKAGLEAGVGENIALGATVSASYTQQGVRPAPWRAFHTPGSGTSAMNYFPGAISELERPVTVSAVNDGVTVNEPYWGNYGTTNDRDWVELDFGAAKEIDNVQVYFYHDGQNGGYSAPQSVGVQVPDGDGWKFIESQTRDYKTVKAKRNDIVFEPTTTDKIRVVVINKPSYYTAIAEIQAFDSGKDVYDMQNEAPAATLARNANRDGNISTELVATVTDDGLPIGADYVYHWSLVSAPADAEARIVTPNSSSTMVLGNVAGSYTFKFTASDGELTAEKEITIDLTVKDAAMDFGPSATIASTGTASWENHNMVNAATTPNSSNPGTAQGWGTWGTSRPGTSQANPAQLTYTWSDAIDLTRTDIYWYDDNGGTRAPTATGFKIEYSTDGTTWQDVPLKDANAYTNGRVLGRYNVFEFASTINAKALRVSIWALQGSGAGTGILRWRAYGLGIESVNEPVYTRVVEGTLPQLPATVDVTFTDGSRGSLPFTWTEVTADMVAEMNVEPFSVFGQNSAYSIYAEAKVYVRPEMGESGITITNVEDSGAFTSDLGKIPALPENAVVAYNDGSRDSFAHDITWNIDPKILYTPGTYAIEGDVSVPSYVGETTAKAHATLTIEAVEDPMLLVLADILNDVLDEDVSMYTVASVAVLNDAIEAVQAIFEDREAYTDVEIIEAVQSLIDAVEGLVEKPLKDHLGDAIDQAKAIDADSLITSVKNNLLEAIDEAEGVFGDDDATQEEIDDAYLALVEAMSETAQVKGDNWGKLDALVSIVKNYQATIYTPASFAAFSTALGKTQDMIADKASYTQTKIDAAYDALYSAWRALARIANFSALQAVIGVAQDIVDDIDDYVPASVAGLADELASAKAVFDDKESTQAQVNTAAASLTAKIVLARLKEDKSKLSASYTKALSIKTAGYTPYSAGTLTAALNTAKTILDAPDGSYTQAQVDTADAQIDKAVKSLIWIGTAQDSAAPSDVDVAASGETFDKAAPDKESGKSDESSGDTPAATSADNAPATEDDVIVADASDVGQPQAAQVGASGSVTQITQSDTPLASGDGAASLMKDGAVSTEDGATAGASAAIYVVIGLLACALIGCFIVMIRRRKGRAE